MKQFLSIIKSRIQRVIIDSGKNEGFSLIELLIVIVIIGILGTIVYTRFMDLPERAKKEAARQQMLILNTALDRYRIDYDNYPSGEDGLEAIKGYLQSRDVPQDPWGSQYIYRSPGESERPFDIISPGPDKQEGTADDIVSWQLHQKQQRPGEQDQ
ncbi:MAG TPA: type II secretion system major pseudopilin GspG [Spirochaetota bacterium]|nr:type II secretion system major pseudopilin GspG [Spirochaetota bacterium]